MVAAAATLAVSMLVVVAVVMPLVMPMVMVVPATAPLAMGMMAVRVIMAVIMIVVMIMMMVVAAAAIGAVDMFGRGAGGLARGAAGLGGGEQVGIDLRLGMVVIVGTAMTMRMVMIVIVAVLRAVRMGVRVAVVMRAGMAVAHGGADAIGAALRRERRLDKGDFGAAHLLHHLDEDVIVADAQGVAGEFGGGMAIAEVPGDAGQFALVGEAKLDETLGSGGDGDDAAVLERQGVARRQRRRLGEVEQEFEPTLGVHDDAAAATLVVVEHDGIDGSGGGGAGGKDGGCAQHRGAFKGNRWSGGQTGKPSPGGVQC